MKTSHIIAACSMIGLSVTALSSLAGAATFQEDLDFLAEHTDVVVLRNQSGKSRAIVAPKLQGRVLTSTALDSEGPSLGWINRELIASGKVQEHINVYGGEDRFWFGPEAGQFGLFFKEDDPFDLEHWQTPACVDTESFEVVSRYSSKVALRHECKLTNYSGATFDVRIDREVSLMDRRGVAVNLGLAPSDAVSFVAIESKNKITNTGENTWEKETGLLSIWILGMLPPSDGTTMVIPFVAGSEEDLGPVVNDAYFGKIPGDRLKVADGVLYFKADGKVRGKIGLSAKRAKPVAGSYDPVSGVLTFVQYDKPAGATDYVNSMWETQDEPYAGDVVNAYNDGPPEPGKEPLGPFYELETSSPAAALAPNASLTHTHRTYHFQGDEGALSQVAKRVLGVDLKTIKEIWD